MYLPACSVYDGTWSSGPIPQELVDFELMHEMGWSWEQLQATPMYVQRYTWDLIQARREGEQQRMDQEQRNASRSRNQPPPGTPVYTGPQEVV